MNTKNSNGPSTVLVRLFKKTRTFYEKGFEIPTRGIWVC